MSFRLSDFAIYSAYCLDLQDGAPDYAEADDVKASQFTYSPQDAESSSMRAMQLHITVEKTVQYDNSDGMPGPPPEALPTLESTLNSKYGRRYGDV